MYSNQCTSCRKDTHCCLTSQACENGVPCGPSLNTSMRISCECPVGFHGNRCQYTIASCNDYITNNNGNGIYTVWENHSQNTYEVFGEFYNGTAWTMVQSYNQSAKIYFQSPFSVDNPITEDSPTITDSYRLSKSRMESIFGYSSKWRITCRASDISPITDYIEVSSASVDIISFYGNGCFTVDHVQVGNKKCTNCTIHLTQTNSNAIHSVFFHPVNQNYCEFHPTDSVACSTGTLKDDRYFGDYQCTNQVHACSNSQSALTQTWFGGMN